MTSSEKAALRQIQDENFRLRVELDHERKCIDEAVSILRRTTDVIIRSKNPIPQEVASIVDDAIKALKEPVPK